jgi:hypothetical protein
LTLVADDLSATLSDQRSKDGRNVAVVALRKRLAFVQDLIEQCTNTRPVAEEASHSDPGVRAASHPI